MMEEQRVPLLVDLERRQVGCALLQAGCGGSPQSAAFRLFSSEDWFIAPTDGMKLINGTMKEFEMYARMCQQARKNKA